MYSKKIIYVMMCGVVLFTTFFTPGTVSALADIERMDTTMRDQLFKQTGGESKTKSYADLLFVERKHNGMRRDIILNYCDTILKTRQGENVKTFGWDERAYRYDPRQSLFVYALCVHIDDIGQGRTFDKKPYRYRNYKKEAFEKVKYEGGKQQNINMYRKKKGVDMHELWGIAQQSVLDANVSFTTCNPGTSMQGCSFSRFVPKIFNKIMNDYANIKLAIIYGYRYPLTSLDEIAMSIDDFNNAYFGDAGDPNAPCNAGGVGYLTKEGLEGNQAHCLHPKTYKELEETIKSAGNLLKNVKYLDTDYILSPEGACDFENPKSSLLRCASGNRGDIGTESDWQVFYNLYLNELMRYNLFLDYYMTTITNNNAFSPLTFGSLSYTFKQNEKEQKTILYEKAISQQATFQTMRMLANVYTTYPVYIALQAYKEDLLRYRKALSKVFTPMDQLYFKLRNVQDKGES